MIVVGFGTRARHRATLDLGTVLGSPYWSADFGWLAVRIAWDDDPDHVEQVSTIYVDFLPAGPVHFHGLRRCTRTEH